MYEFVSMQMVPFEWRVAAQSPVQDPYHAVDLDVIFTHETGETFTVPMFWAREQTWCVRFSPQLIGKYTFEIVGNAPQQAALIGHRGTLAVHAYDGEHPLRRHGPLRIETDQRYLAFADGTPFFWLGDTWWLALADRLNWPDSFQKLVEDRAQKGFTVIQIASGLYPDMDPFDERARNEAGFMFEPGFAGINPAYFDDADRRITTLVEAGLVPCVLGSWGYHLKMLGADQMKRYWRYLVARWGCYPVIWSLAGELAMPYYLDEKFGTGDDPELAIRWVEIGEYVRDIDAHQRLITVHPSSNSTGRDQVTDDTFMDFEMLQPGHDGYPSVQTMLTTLHVQRERLPVKPVIVAEINYEEQVNDSHAGVQRLAFWSAMLSGAAGFSYGANGLWAFSTPEKPWAASPHGLTWTDAYWEDTYDLPGGRQLGLAHRLLQRFNWWRFEPHPEWVSPAATAQTYRAMYAAGIPREVRVIYSYQPSWPWDRERKWINDLEPDIVYEALFWNPRTGAEHSISTVTADKDHRWQVPLEPTPLDWLLILYTTASYTTEQDTSA